MAQASTLYRFKIELSDVVRSVYESFDVRLAMHPSENLDYLLTRLLAYSLNFEDGLSFTDGLANPDEPAIKLQGPHGQILKWIDIGNPAPRRLHKASKTSAKVLVYTYKNPGNLKKEAAGESIHRASEIEIYALTSPFLASAAALLKRDNSWNIVYNEVGTGEGEIVIVAGEQSVIGIMTQHRL